MQRRRQQSGKNDLEILPHGFGQLRRDLQKTQNRIQKYIDRSIDQHRHRQQQDKGVRRRRLEHIVVIFSKIDGHQRACAHGQAEQDGGQEGHQRIRRADRGQRVRPQRPTDDQRVCNIIKLLKQVSGNHRQGKQDQSPGDAPLGQIAIHFSLLKLSFSFGQIIA